MARAARDEDARLQLRKLSTMYGDEFWVPPGLVPSMEREVETTGVYERATSEALLRFVTPGMQVMDCGSNCGFHALNLARAVGPTGRVYCLEANPELVDVLRENVGVNGYSDRVEIFNLGIWKEDGKLAFPLRAKSLGGAGFKSKSRNPLQIWKSRRKVKSWIDVDVVSLATFCRDRSVDLLRMDVEGAEYEVLLASGELLRTRDMTIVMEWLPKNSTRGETKRLYDALRAAGYWIYRITNDGLKRIDSGDDLFTRYEEAWRGGQRDVLCRKEDLGAHVPRWWTA